MNLSLNDHDRFNEIISEIASRVEVMEMKKYIQHGEMTTYDHCLLVARRSFFLARKLRLRVDERSLIRGAMLHDFYLYDWHVRDDGRKRFHGFHHAKTALFNAQKLYDLSAIEKDIIMKHMWPMNIRFPKYRESYLVTLSDKICSVMEILKMEQEKVLWKSESQNEEYD